MPKFIIANWKSNHNLESAREWIRIVDKYLVENNIADLKVVLAPPNSLLAGLSEEIQSSKIELATQNISHLGLGSFTGEVCAKNLEGLEVKYTIAGHSERRRFFGETDQEVAVKVVLASKAGIVPILCVDEPYLNSQAQSLSAQVEKNPQNQNDIKPIIAYEPLEAIGSGKGAGIDNVIDVIKKILELFPQSPVIYGGSVDKNNVKDYLSVADGVLVGGASLETYSFIELLKGAL